MEFTSSRHAGLLYDRQRELDRQNEIAALEGLLALGRSNEGTERCQSDDDDLGGLVGGMNDLSLELTKNEENKSSCVKSNVTSIKTNDIIKTQCTLFKSIIVQIQLLPSQTPNGICYIIRTIINICFTIFDNSIRLADLIDRLTIVKLPFVSIGRLLVYGYWYSLIYVTIQKYPWCGQILRAIFENIILIINRVNTKDTFGTPANIFDELVNDEAFNTMITTVKTTASDAATELGDIVYDYMFNMASKIPILLAIHQLLQLQKENVNKINDHLNKITYGQQQIIDGQNTAIENNDENTNLIIKQFDVLNIKVTDLKKISTDTNLYLQGIDATIQSTSERLGLQIHDVNTAQKNIIQRLNMQDTQATTKIITDLFFAGAPQLMGLAEAIGVPLPRGLLGNGNINAFGGKKRSTRRKCKRSKVYKRGSSKKRGICKNTKKRVKSKKSKKPSKRRMKNTKRK